MGDCSQGKGPLAELDYWRDRNAALSALYEQLKAPRIQRFMELYSRVDLSLEYLRQDLGKYYMEAKDNVRFLTTLERHFKNVTHGSSFQSVSLVNVWHIVLQTSSSSVWPPAAVSD